MTPKNHITNGQSELLTSRPVLVLHFVDNGVLRVSQTGYGLATTGVDSSFHAHELPQTDAKSRTCKCVEKKAPESGALK
ncbi:MAG: hypothetical protein A4E65_01477 [Syntrophorhabdus sp. PtaU1.Bin153]|nr:MAG: hypothetical protein A4E65_01477 [Syntrophorhabdus sp. PtaU1.Bin153]